MFLRILQVAPFFPPHVGGIESHVEGLSRKLAEAGHEVVVCTSRVPRSARSGRLDGVEVRRFRVPFSPLNNPLMPSLVLELLRRGDFDVVHTHGHYQASSSAAVLSNVCRRRPMVLTCHGATLGYSGWKRWVERVFDGTAGRCTLRSADRIIALTPTQSELLRGLGAPAERIVVVPVWVGLPPPERDGGEAAFRAAHGLADGKVLLFVGRLLPVKGLNYLIEALPLTRTAPVLVVIGGEAPGYPGTLESLVQQVKRLGLERRVLFLGRFEHEALADAYAAADLFVLPSLGEGLPVALLEAMAHGRCVLATDVPGSRDVVKDGVNGALVPARDPGALAAKIDALLADGDLRARLGAHARRDVERKYAPGPVLDRILEVYRQAIEVRGRRGTAA